MLTIVQSLCCVSIVAVSVDAQESLKEWPRIHSSTAVHYRTTSKISQELALGKRTSKLVFEVHTEETHAVREVGSDGVSVVSITRTRVWGTVRGSTFKSVVSFDTAKDGRIHPLARSLVDGLLPVTMVTVDRSSKVLSVRKASKYGELGEPDDHERDTSQFLFVHAPQLPIVVGASWRPAEGVHECAPGGCVELVTRNELAKMDKDSLTVVTVAVDDHAQDAETGHRVERTISLSRRDGLLLEMRASGTTRSDGVEKTARIEMERVPQQAKAQGRETPRPLRRTIR